jgi:hypothetical protein
MSQDARQMAILLFVKDANSQLAAPVPRFL